MDKNEVIAFFNSVALGWDAIQVRDEEIIDLILRKGAVTSGAQVLDVACGTGVLFPDYISRGAVATGIDISPEMVNIARKKYPEIDVICGDAQTYDFGKSFDVVMIYNAFPHFPEPEKLIESLADKLKTGGRLSVAHGISEKELEKCHSGAARNISIPLVKKEALAEMMKPWFEVDVLISDDRMYMVSGVKK